MIAKVIIDLSLDRTFDYGIPPELSSDVAVGSRVQVPFGNSLRKGFVLDLIEKSDCEKLKNIAGIADNKLKIPENLLRLGQWMADYYCCSQEQAIRTLLPGAVRSGKISDKLQKIYSIPDAEKAKIFVQENTSKKNAKKRIDVLNYLLENIECTADELTSECTVSGAVLKTLLEHQLIAFSEKIVRNDLFSGRKTIRNTPLIPNYEQQKALDIIEKMLKNQIPMQPILLHGVTNSGKTEVYLQAIAQAIELDLQSIVLVPEISLTPQTIRRFRARFGDDISVLHSRLSDRERFDEWMRINNQEVKIVVGARSALFAPLRRPGLIVVDEEHESTYKQSEAPRYNARDVAVIRGNFEHALVILGTATPSAESYFNAQSGKYQLIEMKGKVEEKLQPVIKIVDQRLSAQNNENKSSFFSPYLIDSVKFRIMRGEQTILFLNRRGYARVMSCELCGYEAKCPNCSINYTYSRQNQTLSCHLCGSTIPAPQFCPNCQSPDIRYSGSGTEKIEIAANAVFPNARIARMDSDTMKNAEAYETVLNKFKRGDVDILIGTQMIAKGLHFPNVTLVGIINADQSLAIPDFRAPERTFQLITQVAGRAGRGDMRGEVIIQTYNPTNETIQFAANYDFLNFYKFDMEVREMLLYPPFGHLIAVHFRSENEDMCVQYAEKFRSALLPYQHDAMKISGPSPAPVPRIKNKFRYVIIIRGHQLKTLRSAVRHMLLTAKLPPQLDAYADVDAQSLM